MTHQPTRVPTENVRAGPASTSRRLDEILETVAVGVVVVRERKILWANSTFSALTGYELGELVGSETRIFYARDSDWERIGNDGYARLRESRTYSAEALFRKKDGADFRALVTGRCLAGEQGKPSDSIWSFVDLNERLQAERAEAELADLRRAMFERTGAIKLLIEPSGGRLIDANPAAYAFYGYARDTLLGMSIYDINAAPASEVAVFLRRADVHERDHFLFRHRLASGETRWVEVYSTPVSYGNRRCLFSIVFDVNARIEAERAHAQAEERYRNLVNCLKEVVFRTDAQGKWMFLNPAWEEVTGFPVADSLGTLFLDYVHPDDRKRNREHFAHLIEGKKDSCRHEVRYLRRDGGFRWIEVWALPTRDHDGKLTGTAGTLTDITARKQAEEAHARMEAQLRHAQKLEAVGRLAGGVAHDFNNILAALMLNIDMILYKGDLPAGVRKSILEMQPLIQRGSALTRQMLLFARRSPVRRRPLNLNLLLSGLLAMLQRLVGEHVRIVLEDDGAPHWINADPSLIEQAVTNLVINARDAMPGGGAIDIGCGRVEVGEAHVSAHSEARPGGHVCLTVRDSGVGMDDGTLQRLFEPFFTTKEVGKGTGLGLSSARGVVLEHGGWIEVESAVGQGSVFRVYFPESVPPADAGAVEAGSPNLSLEAGTILLVEDEESVRKAISQILAGKGYRVIQAGNGPHAIELWATEGENVDLLVTDIVMPSGIQGMELARQLKSRRPELPVLLMTGYSAEVVASGNTLPPGTKILQKPCPAAELLDAVRERLDRSRRPEADSGGGRLRSGS